MPVSDQTTAAACIYCCPAVPDDGTDSAGHPDSQTHRWQYLLMCREGSKEGEGTDLVVHANELVYEGEVSTGDLVRCAPLW